MCTGRAAGIGLLQVAFWGHPLIESAARMHHEHLAMR